jgi:hypothetical protein
MAGEKILQRIWAMRTEEKEMKEDPGWRGW